MEKQEQTIRQIALETVKSFLTEVNTGRSSAALPETKDGAKPDAKVYDEDPIKAMNLALWIRFKTKEVLAKGEYEPIPYPTDDELGIPPEKRSLASPRQVLDSAGEPVDDTEIKDF